MKFYQIDAEVAGALGPRSIIDRTAFPPLITRLHYEFEDWLGDAIVESFPAFLAAEDLMRSLLSKGITGATFDAAEVSLSEQFAELCAGAGLPKFVWLKPGNHVGRDDFAVNAEGRLVLSQRAIDVVSEHGLSNAVVTPLSRAES